jgi:uncharacterized membrane protein
MKKLNLILFIGTIIVSALLLPQLPQTIPMHWGFTGQPDSFYPKNIGVWMLPLLMIVMILLFHFLPSFDPNKKKYRLFKQEWDIIQTGLIGFFAYLQGITLYISLNPGTAMMPLMFLGLGTLFILLGNYLSKIRQNWFIGIKLPWTLASEDNWNKTHRYASWCFVIAGIVTLIEANFIWYAPIVIFGSILLATFLPMVYSFLLFRNSIDKMKYVYIALILIALLVGMMRLVSGEDDWICQDGGWVPHGVPSAPAPNGTCR